MSETTFLNFLPLASVACPDPVENSTQTEDWLTLVCQMRSQNRELLKTVSRLERTLADSQKQLQSQLRQLQKAEILLCQQTDTLQQAQTQIADLNQKLAACQQENQRQQLQIETFAERFASSQERVAQLEDECLCIQQNCQERAAELALAEGQVFASSINQLLPSFALSDLIFLSLGIDRNQKTMAAPANWSEPILPPL